MPFSKTIFSLGAKREFGINIFNPKRNENFPSGMSKVLCEVDKILTSILSLQLFSNIFVFFFLFMKIHACFYISLRHKKRIGGGVWNPWLF